MTKATTKDFMNSHLLKLWALIILAFNGGAILTAPIFAILGSGKMEGFTNPKALAIMAIGALAFVTALILAHRLMGNGRSSGRIESVTISKDENGNLVERKGVSIQPGINS